MDPDTNLAEQLVLAAVICATAEPDGVAHAAARLADLVLALDRWLSAGGFWPRRWSTA